MWHFASTKSFGKWQQAERRAWQKLWLSCPDYERKDPTAVKFVAECLAKTNTTMDQLLVNWLTEDVTHVLSSVPSS